MAVEFRCEKCGKLLSLEAEPGQSVKCPDCKGKITVPAALASLPQPKVPTASPPLVAAPIQPGAAPPPVAVEEEEEEEEAEDESNEAVMTAMAAVMPWVISLFFHVGLVVVLSFALMFFVDSPAVLIPVAAGEETDDPGGVENPGAEDADSEASQPDETTTEQFSKTKSDVSMENDVNEASEAVALGSAGGGASGGPLARTGPGNGDGAGPKSDFMGSGGRGAHVVYVVDRSGSMQDTFSDVLMEMLRDISKKSVNQDFHIIFFADGELEENRRRCLVKGTPVNKREAAAFLENVIPGGQTDPIPALNRAFEVLSKANKLQPGKLIYLLTDGEFPDNKAVLARLAKLNAKKEVVINTILHRYRPPQAELVLKAIAKQNGGNYSFVGADH